MERKVASDYPQELLDLFHEYQHGDIDRRTFLNRAGKFAIGGLTGLFLATLGLDVHMHDTYFVVAHFHYIMVGGAIMGYLGGLHYWWPKITGSR